MAIKAKFKSLGFTAAQLKIFAALKTPQKIQDFLNKMPFNFELKGDTCSSPQQVLIRKSAHCAEGAVFAAAALWFNGGKPLLMDLKTASGDFDHVVALFQVGIFWGAISKTNHAVLRYREPIYKSVRELAMSYFHEYFLHSGRKTLRAFSEPFDLSKIRDASWLVSRKNLWDLIYDLDKSKHHKILSRAQVRGLRRADSVEIKAGKLEQQKRR